MPTTLLYAHLTFKLSYVTVYWYPLTFCVDLWRKRVQNYELEKYNIEFTRIAVVILPNIDPEHWAKECSTLKVRFSVRSKLLCYCKGILSETREQFFRFKAFCSEFNSSTVSHPALTMQLKKKPWLTVISMIPLYCNSLRLPNYILTCIAFLLPQDLFWWKVFAIHRSYLVGLGPYIKDSMELLIKYKNSQNAS